MKSEPDCYSISDLQKQKRGMWDGVRNYQVRNMMRDQMQVGDKALFYHSSAGKETGVAGTMTIVKAAYPDPTQFDPTLTFSSPEQVTALKRIVKQSISPTTKISLKYSGKDNDKVSVRVNPKSEHPDLNSDPTNPRWLCVDVKFENSFPRLVTLQELKLDPAFADMPVLQKGNRLSVMPIQKKHFDRIVKLASK